jgi:hypothetical protein
VTAGGDGGGPCRGSGAEAYWDPGDQGRVSLVGKGLVFLDKKVDCAFLSWSCRLQISNGDDNAWRNVIHGRRPEGRERADGCQIHRLRVRYHPVASAAPATETLRDYSYVAVTYDVSIARFGA